MVRAVSSRAGFAGAGWDDRGPGLAAIAAAGATLFAARGGDWPQLLLSVTADNAAGITSALDTLGLETDVKIAVDPKLGPGEVQLTWSEGGAEIDVEAVAKVALERFQMQLDGCATKGAT